MNILFIWLTLLMQQGSQQPDYAYVKAKILATDVVAIVEMPAKDTIYYAKGDFVKVTNTCSSKNIHKIDANGKIWAEIYPSKKIIQKKEICE